MILLYFIAVFFAGIISGVLGVGGGMVFVPLFAIVLTTMGYTDNIMHMALATSLACIIFTSSFSAFWHKKHIKVSRHIVLSWGLFIFIGAILGAFFTIQSSAHSIKILYSVIVLSLCLYKIIIGNKRLLPYESLTKKGLFFPILSGWFSASVGLGGGANVPLLTLFGVPVREAVAIASIFGIVISITSAIIYNNSGLIEWSIVSSVVPVVLIATKIGVHIAHKIQKVYILWGYILFTILSVIAVVLK